MASFTILSLLVAVISIANGDVWNITYGTDHQQIFDLYLPKGIPEIETKVIIMIHGGAWGMGNKGEMDRFIAPLQVELDGHYIANMEYRLGTQASPGFPKQLEDIALLIAYIKSSFAQEVSFALMGGSAGAHLSMLYDYAWDSQDDVKIIVDIVGPTDLTDASYTANPLYSGLFLALVGPCYYTECPEKYNETSPIIYATENSAPTIGFYGNQDILIPNTQMPILDNKLNELGVPHEFTVYEGGHADWVEEDQKDLITKVGSFVRTYW